VKVLKRGSKGEYAFMDKDALIVEYTGLSLKYSQLMDNKTWKPENEQKMKVLMKRMNEIRLALGMDFIQP